MSSGLSLYSVGLEKDNYITNTLQKYFIFGYFEGHIICALAVLSWAKDGRIDGQIYNKYFASIF